ncbi:MAG: aldo/keto reductase [Cellulosilyticaceae bacterium]
MVEVSKLGLGTWAIGGGEWWGDSDEARSIETIREAINEGITLIDTAPAYGFGYSEEVVGKGIKGKRDQVILSTKCGLWWHDERGADFFEQAGHKVKRCLEPDTIKRELEMSLRRLDTDYIDIYFTHWQAVEPAKTPIAETMKCLMDLKAQGMIRQIGASNVDQDHIKAYVAAGELDVIQEKYSMLDRRIEEELVPICEANKIKIMAYSPLEQGLLTGKVGMDYVVGEKEARAGIAWYQADNRIRVIQMLNGWSDLTRKYNCTMAQLVTAWTGMQRGISYVLCGARKPEHIHDTAQAARVTISREDAARMREDVLRLGNPV